MHDTDLKQMLAFVLVASNHGPLIVNRLDFHAMTANEGYGVGGQLLQTSSYQTQEVDLVNKLLRYRRHYYGDGVVAIDCGANIGIFTIEWARTMAGWGRIIAIEAQERIFYALAGNIALNNCFNATAIHGAVSFKSGTIDVPVPDYLTPGSFGSLELRKHPETEFIGQEIDYNRPANIRQLTIDELNLLRVDFIKLDIQRMEMEALEGAKETIRRSHPIMLIEHVRLNILMLRKWLADRGYSVVREDTENILAAHKDDSNVADW